MDTYTTLILFTALGAASLEDCRTLRVPLWLTWGMMVVGIAFPSPWGGIAWRVSSAGVTALLLLLLLLLAPNGMGGSDIRAIVAFGAYFARSLLPFFLLLGLVQPLFLLVLRGQGKNLSREPESGGPFLPFLLIVAALCFGLLQ